MHFFTSITTNYLPKARILARSIKKHCPNAVFHLVLCDKYPYDELLESEPFDTILFIEDLGLPVDNLEQWIFKHTVVELCTAVKGQSVLALFEKMGADKVVYLDPDIVVLHSLEDLDKMLDKHSVILTPHQVEPDKTFQGIIDNEICSLQHGVFNLGFLAVRNSKEGVRFVKWWRDRLLQFCYDDIPNGLFTDQKWVDLAPAFFDDLYILRDKTYNVATWNLSHRIVEKDSEGKLYVEGAPLKFYHFSGFDSGAQEVMLKRYANGNPVLFELRDWYIQELEKEGQKELGNYPCTYDYFSNGEKITKEHRRLYRSRQDLIQAFPFPTKVTEDKICYYWWYIYEYLKKNELQTTVENDEKHSVEAEINALRAELQAILNSKSWKITRPLRKIREFFK